MAGAAAEAVSEPLPAALGAWSLPARVGAANVGVPVGGVVVGAGGRGAAAGCRRFRPRGTWNTSKPTDTAPRTAAAVVGLFCFALGGSTDSFVITALLAPAPL